MVTSLKSYKSSLGDGGQFDQGLPGGSVVKNLPACEGDTGDMGSIPGWGRSPGGGQGIPLQCSCLGNQMDRGAWWATVQGVAKELDSTKQVQSTDYHILKTTKI